MTILYSRHEWNSDFVKYVDEAARLVLCGAAALPVCSIVCPPCAAASGHVCCGTSISCVMLFAVTTMLTIWCLLFVCAAAAAADVDDGCTTEFPWKLHQGHCIFVSKTKAISYCDAQVPVDMSCGRAEVVQMLLLT